MEASVVFGKPICLISNDPITVANGWDPLSDRITRGDVPDPCFEEITTIMTKSDHGSWALAG